MGRKAKTQEELEKILQENFKNIILTSVYTNSKEDFSFKCTSCGREWKQKIFNLSGCSNCKPDKRYETLSHEDYLDRLKSKEIKDIVPIDKYISSRTNIKHQCLKCNFEWSAKPNNILSGYGCPFCAGQAVVQGINDLCTTDPNVSKLLLNQDDGFKYSRMSGKKLDWICPDCKSVVKQKMVSNVVQQGLHCPKCSDGNSIPNKFMANILDSLNIEFETEKIFSWSKNRRYDFYIQNLSCIIEMNGRQHYGVGFEYVGGRTLGEEIKNDKFKYQLARQNSIVNYVVINCKLSSLSWMKNSILNSGLAELINIKNIKWEDCFNASLHSNVVKASSLWNNGYSIQQIMSKLHISNTTACDYLRKANSIKLCNYSGVKERFKKVVCINTNEVFDSIREAQEKYNIYHVGDCCRGLRQYAGTDPLTGEKISWRFLTTI